MAELRGILRALFEPGRFDIFNDSSYGVRTVTRLLTEDLPRPLPLLKNGDLLWRLAVALRSRPPDSVRIQHVKGHTSAEDVAAGRTTAAHRLGNQAADQAAGRALAQHAGFEDFLKGAQGKLRLTSGVQQMFLAIAEAVGFDRSAPAGPMTVVPVAEEIAPEPFDVEYRLKSLPYCVEISCVTNAQKANYRYGQVFTDVLYLYFNGLEWPLGPGRGQLAVTFLELMLDAIASVRLWMPWAADAKPSWPKWPHLTVAQARHCPSAAAGAHLGSPTLRQQLRIFTDAARDLGQFCGEPLWDGRETEGRPGYVSLGSLAGLTARPRLQCPEVVFRWLQQLERLGKGTQSSLDIKMPLVLPPTALRAAVRRRPAAASASVGSGVR